MTVQCPIGPEANILDPSAKQVHRLWLNNPILSVADIQMLKRSNYRGWKTAVIDIAFDFRDGVQGYIETFDRICREAQRAVESDHQLIIISDRAGGPQFCPISSLLALGCIHHHLIETRLRMKVGLIVETAEAREVHHICVLLGYGADGINPYLVFEMAKTLRDQTVIDATMSDEEISAAFGKAIDTGMAKVMAKMGISTLQSYKGAQIFEAVGLGADVIDRCFRGTPSRVGGVGMEILAREGLERHQLSFHNLSPDAQILRNPGLFHWRAGGESHINEPGAIASLQEASIREDTNAYKNFRSVTMESVRRCCLRGQMDFVTDREKVDISEVESAAEIVKRFATGAMSFGSISLEAHQTLAIAMNRIGGKSNTGEGGENADRYLNQDPEFNRRSAIKQVASGRFGVTAAYIANSDDLQIKISQGAKPVSKNY
jgi:glutamate synthase (NADH)